MAKWKSPKSLVSLLVGVGLIAIPNQEGRSYPSDGLVTAALVAEVKSVQPGEPFWVAVRLGMRDGWKVNWVNPGDAGLAPTVTWSLPEGFGVSSLLWPYPEKFSIPELAIFGYEGEVLLLAEITPPTSLKPLDRVTLGARVDWLACREACVPGGADLKLELSVNHDVAIADGELVEAFRRTREALPVTPRGWDFSARVSRDKISIRAVPPAGETLGLDQVTFFPIVQNVIENSSRQELLKKDAVYQLDIERSDMSMTSPSRIKGVLVSREGWGSIPYKALAIDVPVDE
ncbi:MAG: protein-disulfide reductase DsbD family protein [Candidatus Krumholzibacteria bacterium]|nr:protein-disulfide reductase DsbD family protein [Candidatus Krumholzibacteria bacterium]